MAKKRAPSVVRPPRNATDLRRQRAAAAAAPPPVRPDWRWRTFPVFTAFVCGALLAFIVNEGSINPAAFVLQLLALLGVGYAVAHLIVRNFVAAGRARRAAARVDEYEDVVVHPDDPASPV